MGNSHDCQYKAIPFNTLALERAPPQAGKYTEYKVMECPD